MVAELLFRHETAIGLPYYDSLESLICKIGMGMFFYDLNLSHYLLSVSLSVSLSVKEICFLSQGKRDQLSPLLASTSLVGTPLFERLQSSEICPLG